MKEILSILLIILVSSITVCQKRAELELKADDGSPIISRHIYGHFSEHLGRCIYDGIWVDPDLKIPQHDRMRLDVVEALKKINIPNLRWPGGCFADEYHWRDGIGPRAERPSMINTHWGMTVEDNSFGTHEFLELCTLIGAEPYLAANVGSGTVEEMNDWVEYVNFEGETTLTKIRKQNGQNEPFGVKFWGIGNESWGCGGNMTPEYFANLYKQYATYARDYPGTRLSKIASGANAADYKWTEVMMKNVPNWMMWGLSVHYYTLPTGDWGKKGSATEFSKQEYFNTMKNCLFINELLDNHIAIMDKYDPERKVALVVDEWGIWTDSDSEMGVLFQQNSLRDALIAGTTLNSFNRRADRIKMANLAQTINVLQALILTKDEEMVLTPTYHVFDMYQVHQDARLIPLIINTPVYELDDDKLESVNASASINEEGVIHVSLVNIQPEESIQVSIDLKAFQWSSAKGEVLTGDRITSINTFENPENVVIRSFKSFEKRKAELWVDLPPRSVVMLEIR